MAYGIDDIDEHGTVKPGVAITLASVFLSRQLFYAPLLLLARRRSRGSRGTEMDMSFVEIFSVWELVACVPALAVLVALLKRAPDAAQWVRWLNRHARTLLLTSAFIQLMVVVYVLAIRGVPGSFFLTVASISLITFMYLLRSQRLVDLANDFPQEAPEKGQAGG